MAAARGVGGEGEQTPELAAISAEETDAARAAYHYGQYLRLLAYLRHRQPDDHVGYSILIFRLTAEEIDHALNDTPAELDDEPWIPSRVKFL